MNRPTIELDIVYHLHDVQHLNDPNAVEHIAQDARIELAADWIARQFGLQKLYASIAVVDDATIQQLNAQRLGHDWPTDVISFLLDQTDSSVEGEVIASAETAAKVCVAAGWNAQDELLLYIVHGLLHVAGMDDLELEERQAMRQAERECLLAIGVAQANQHGQGWDDIAFSEMER